MYKSKSYVSPYGECGDYQSPRTEVLTFNPEVLSCNSFNGSSTESLEDEVEFEW